MSSKAIGMVGGGSWATALVKILNESNHQVNWWLRGQQAVDHLLKKHHNSHYLSSVSFSPGLISPTNDLREVIRLNDVLFLAVPATFLPEVLENFLPEDFQDKILISAIKGMIPDKNQIIAAYLHQHLGIPFEKIVIVSGPCHAEEVALEKLSYLTLACTDEAVALSICKLLRCNYLRCISSDDIYGTEYGAVLKNIYALAAGICHGLGYGDNFQAVLISNAIEEMECFVKAVHPISRDIKNSAYLGDLLVTAYSQFSRNRTLGTMIGKGYSVKTALLETNMVAEGYNAAKCIHEVNKQYHVPLLISEATYRILYEGISARDEMQRVSEKIS